MSEIQDLYQELIIDHYKNPRNQQSLTKVTHQAEGYNPLCGDMVSIQLCVEDEVIREVCFESSGCAISVASASVMSEAIKGTALPEAVGIFDRFHGMLTEGMDVEKMGKLEAFRGVRAFPARIKCATMPWHALKSALEVPGQQNNPGVFKSWWYNIVEKICFWT